MPNTGQPLPPTAAAGYDLSSLVRQSRWSRMSRCSTSSGTIHGLVVDVLGDAAPWFPHSIPTAATHLLPDGVAVVGFGTGRGYMLDAFDADLCTAGFTLEHRFATWDLRPWHDDAEFAVSVLRLPAPEPS